MLYHLAPAGSMALLLANGSMSSNTNNEGEIRKKLIQSGAVDVMVSVGPNFFYTVTLPATLWFFDKGKPEALREQVLFLSLIHI